MVINWSNPAKADLKSIFEYIAHDSRHYAKKVIKSIVNKSLDLEFSPRRGRVVAEIDNTSIREIFVYSYRLMYEICPDESINILGVIHGNRNFTIGDVQ